MLKQLYAIAALHVEDMKNLEARQEEFLSVDASSWDISEDSAGKPYQVINGLATYSVRGKMMNDSNLFTKLFGIATYKDISDTLAMMANDEEVEQVLMDFSSPGGSVAGISDISDNWSKLNAVKPITVHTPSTLSSAALWISSNSDNIYASETADIGSIGVIAQHVSQEKALDKAGIKVTEIKSAPLKAVGSPAKDLNAEELAHIQKKVDESAELFKHQIYKTRPAVRAEAFTGEAFVASEALTLGLIDGIKTYSEVFTELSSASIAEDETINPGGFTMKRQVTTAMAEAAIASGADPSSLEIISQEAYDALEVEETTETVIDEPTAEEAVESDAAATELEIAELTENNTDLEARITELSDKLDKAVNEIIDLEAEVEASNSDPLKVIAVERLAVMRIALGMTAVDMSEFPVQMLMTEYNALDKAFKKELLNQVGR